MKSGLDNPQAWQNFAPSASTPPHSAQEAMPASSSSGMGQILFGPGPGKHAGARSVCKAPSCLVRKHGGVITQIGRSAQSAATYRPRVCPEPCCHLSVLDELFKPSVLIDGLLAPELAGEADAKLAEQADLLVTMGCDDQCPYIPASATPIGSSPIRRAVRSRRSGQRAMIARRVGLLVDELTVA